MVHINENETMIYLLNPLSIASPAVTYLFKVNHRDTRKVCEITPLFIKVGKM